MSAADRVFIDTNVIVYLLSADRTKADRAEAVLAAGGVVSVQVLNEFVAVARRKLALDWPDVREVLTAVRANCEVAALTAAIHDRALAIAEAAGLHIYDAAIIAAAAENGCTTLCSEDLSHGQRIDGVRIVNPFRAA
jgi:predicted nucleic acid-binding protein